MIARTQDWKANFSYSPPLVEIYIPDSQVVAVVKAQAPERTTIVDWVRVVTVGGQEFLVTGKVSDYDRIHLMSLQGERQGLSDSVQTILTMLSDSIKRGELRA